MYDANIQNTLINTCRIINLRASKYIFPISKVSPLKFDESGIRSVLILCQCQRSSCLTSDFILHFMTSWCSSFQFITAKTTHFVLIHCQRGRGSRASTCVYVFFVFVRAFCQFPIWPPCWGRGLRRLALIELALKITHFFRLRVPASVSVIYSHLNWVPKISTPPASLPSHVRHCSSVFCWHLIPARWRFIAVCLCDYIWSCSFFFCLCHTLVNSSLYILTVFYYHLYHRKTSQVRKRA